MNSQIPWAVEKIGERFLACRRLENVILFDFDPGQGATLSSKRVAFVRESFLFGQ